jgi:hypothetical protein
MDEKNKIERLERQVKQLKEQLVQRHYDINELKEKIKQVRADCTDCCQKFDCPCGEFFNCPLDLWEHRLKEMEKKEKS